MEKAQNKGGLPPLPTLPLDPTFEAQKAKAQGDAVLELSKMAAADSASVMARFGTRQALAGVSSAGIRAA